eukprot:TRINITY_DN3228_c0_g2_i4.p2 TRINITY_DN3228_c0_g2~~TRINITY_DN3228_c0_g2_i4.p2  ORF type:complete len:461 (+),score=111.71 TRINITY_DN3228_c0_g2_i4:2008-3390(+)
MNVTVEAQVVRLQGDQAAKLELTEEEARNGLKRAVVNGLQLGEDTDWVFERYDTSFDEWLDLEDDDDLDAVVKLRVTEKRRQSSKSELMQVLDSVAEAEQNLHELMNAMQRPPTLHSADLASHSDGRQDADSVLSHDSLRDDHHGPHEVHEAHDTDHDECIDVLTSAEAYAKYYGKIGTEAFFVDVRGKEETQKTGMIAGAVRAHKGLLEWHTDSESSLFIPVLLCGKPLILYASGNVTEGGRPEIAARTLTHMGVPRVLIMKEGLNQWKASGYPVSYEEAVYSNVEPTVKLRRTVHDMVLEATKGTQFISVQASYELLDVPDIVFVDVRSKEEVHATGVIPGAALANRELIEWYTDPQSQSHHKLFNPLFGSGKKLILYGAGLVNGGRPILVSATLRKVLPYHANVCVLEGGFNAWVAAGHPVEPVDVMASPEEPPPHAADVSAVASFFPRKSSDLGRS